VSAKAGAALFFLRGACPPFARRLTAPSMCARRFLMVIFVLTLLVVAAAFALFQWGHQVIVSQSVPRGQFEAPAGNGPDYSASEQWIARPGIADDPSWWRPDGEPRPLATRPAHAFYIHPTTYLQRDHWNAPLDDAESRQRAELFVQSQASAFSDVAAVWAPRYRQAAFGAFLLSNEDAQKALELAYRDLTAAFGRFLATIPEGEPIILAGHSQGALHLLRLLGEHGPQLRGRLVAAYVVGWPVSTAADLPATGLPACERAGQSGCVLSWQSFAEPANPSIVLDAWDGTRGPDGTERRRRDMLCVNPLTGSIGGAAPAQSNPGTLVPTADMSDARVVSGRVGARCENGFLLIDGDIPNLGPFVLPGNNYHVYDYVLFWEAIRRDVQRRLSEWQRR